MIITMTVYLVTLVITVPSKGRRTVYSVRSARRQFLERPFVANVPPDMNARQASKVLARKANIATVSRLAKTVAKATSAQAEPTA